jgi:lantibiotic modifying enzyme
LLGFSHGVAGIVWALLRLSAVSGEPRFCDAALQGLAYERACFSEVARNWPVLRPPAPESRETRAPEQRFMTAWCHGASGIGLARVSTLRLRDDATTRSEVRVALETTVREGFGHNHSLCHGDLGNLDLLLQAGRVLGDARWQEETRRIAGPILGSIRQHGWLCGVPHQVETPGLMTGLAGIGYELLRLAAPERVPSVLTLEAPLMP